MILTTSEAICIARDPASCEAEWSELARRRARPNIFLTPQWLAVARAYDPRQQITLSIGDRKGIAALARQPDGAITFAGGELTDEQDVVAAPEDAELVADALGAWIAAEDLPRVDLGWVPEETPTAKGISRSLGAGGYAVHVERLVTAPRLELAPDFDSYLASLGKKERHELRRKVRRLETGRRVAFRFASGGERDTVLDRFFALHRSAPGEKGEFMTARNERFFRDVADAIAARGWLRLGVLSVEGDDAAVLFAFAYEGTLALYNAAYDPALAPLSVGIVAHANAIRDAIAEGLRSYDLLRGAEPYKYDLGATDHWLLRIEATRP
jgi:CelD/BcsL family acetyltransferase involved in cellulose biosynthesis